MKNEECKNCKHNYKYGHCHLMHTGGFCKYEPKENKVIFESEEEARQLYNDTLNNHDENDFIKMLKQKGYICKSAIEKAEDKRKEYNPNDDVIKQINDLRAIMHYHDKAIQELKAENEKLKNWR